MPTIPGLVGATEDHVIDRLPVDAGVLFHQRLERHGREIAGPDGRGDRFGRMAAEGRGLRTLGAALQRPDPLTLVDRAQEVLRPFGLKVVSFDAGPEEITLRLPAEAVAGVDLLARRLERSASFRDVRPSLDRDRRQLSLTMAVRKDAPSL